MYQSKHLMETRTFLSQIKQCSNCTSIATLFVIEIAYISFQIKTKILYSNIQNIQKGILIEFSRTVYNF